MGLPAQLKSKKVIFGVVIVVLILGGIFGLKFMTSGGTEVAPEKPRSAHRAQKKTAEPQKKEATPPPTQSPLFEALKAFKDPFRKEDPKLAELQDKINDTKKEIEFLKVTLEEKRLRQEIKDLEKSMSKTSGATSVGTETEGVSPAEKKAEDKSPKRVLVKAILITDEEKTALIVSGDEESWVHEGEKFDGWEIKEIKKESVVLMKAGKTFVFFYDRPAVRMEGES